jgi:DNA-binding helix-hairpin-helix protein with protein kinase domain
VGVPEVVPPRIAVPRDFTQNVVACVAVGAAVLFSFALLSMLSSVFFWLGIFGLVSCLSFGTWWFILETIRRKTETRLNYPRDREMRAVHAEYQVRYSAWSAWFAQLERLEQRWRSAAAQYAHGFSTRKAQLEGLKARYLSLQAEYQAERRALDQNREAEQRAEFLASHNLDDAEIDGIGPGLKATLRSYGIETADQIVDVDILAVPGFGGVRTQKLLQWRYGVERTFRFDPNAGLPKDRLAATELKYAQLRQSCEIELQQGPEALQAIAADAVRQCGEILKKIQDVLIPLAQAEVDLSLIHLDE